jgi:heptosyltransferase III
LKNSIQNIKKKMRRSVRLHPYFVQYYVCKLLAVAFYQKYIKGRSLRLICLTEHIGDVIAFSPVAEQLHQNIPKTYIIWLINPKFIEIIKHNPYINYSYPVYCDALIHKIKKYRWIPLLDPRFNDNNFCQFCKTDKMKQTIDGNFNLNNYYNYGNLLSIFCQILGLERNFAQNLNPKIVIPDRILSKTKEQLAGSEPYTVIHAESNDPHREWTDTNWQLLIEYILANSKQNLIILGLKKRLTISNRRVTDLSGQLSLLQTAAVIQQAKQFIGIDSSLAHIANALRIPSVIILGKFREMEKYMPYSGFFANEKGATIIFDKNTPSQNVKLETILAVLKYHNSNND